MNEIHLSVVATSRNDNHGGGLTERMQHFVDGLAAQCDRHDVRAELVLVEWNPPQDRGPLIEALRWPERGGACDVRIVTVPPEVHRTLEHAADIRLFQMIAKNVGARRARGRFVLATNVDVLFSDEAMRFMRDGLEPGTLYLADRVDVPASVPQGDDFAAVLRFCEASAFRVNAGSLTLSRSEAGWRVRDRLKSALGARGAHLLHFAEGFVTKSLLWAARNPRWTFRRLVGHGRAALAERTTALRARPGFAGTVTAGIARSAARVSRSITRGLLGTGAPFTNACGDFTLMAKEDWERVRGYAEWPIFSWHLDSLLVYQALGAGLAIRRLAPRARVFHIDHEGGYTPEGAAQLFARLRARGIPFLTDQDLQRHYEQLAAGRRRGAEPFNGPGWGMRDIVLPESRPQTHSLGEPA